VLSLEGDEWYSPSKVAGLADTYVANHDSRTIQSQGSKFRPSTSNGYGVDKSYQGHSKTTSGQQSPHLNERGRENPGFRYCGRGRGNATNGQGERRCFTCNAIGHIVLTSKVKITLVTTTSMPQVEHRLIFVRHYRVCLKVLRV